MTLELPKELAAPLRSLGRAWPTSDEKVLRSIAEAFAGLRPTVQSGVLSMETALARVEASNDARLTGPINYFLSTEGNLSSLKDFDEAVESISESFEVMAGIVVALKATIIGHLVLLATLEEGARHLGPSGATAYNAALSRSRRLIDESVDAAIRMVEFGGEEEDETEPEDHPRPQELERLAAWAEHLHDSEDFESAVETWQDLLSQLPEPALAHPLAMRSHASLGDALFELGQFGEANRALAQALLAGGTDEAFVWLRKGQSLVEMGDEEAGVDALASAYMLMGGEILDDEDPKYRALLARHIVMED